VEDDSGSGCGKWLLIGIGAFLVLAVLGNLFGDDDPEVTASGGSSRSTSTVAVPSTTAVPPTTAAPRARWDNEMTRCSRDSYGLVDVRGQIVNQTNSEQSYYLEANFEQGDLRLDWTNPIVSNVAPGQRAAWEMIGSNDYAGGFSCRITVEEL
jgi:hypothetical protein